MNLGEIRSLVKKRFDNKLDSKYSDSFLNSLINEALKEFCAETLILDTKDDSLTYNSSKGGFTLPSDFIKVKYLEWEFSSGYTRKIEAMGIEEVKRRRNVWATDSENTDTDSVSPSGYTIVDNVIILDSLTETSPTLYYFKYDTSLSSDSDSPTIESRFHKYLADYVCFELEPKNSGYLQRWQYGLQQAICSKNRTEGYRAKYVGL